MKIKSLLITAVLATVILCSAGSVKAVDNSTLITQLQAQITQLIAQLNALKSQQDTTQTWCHTFNKNLKIDDFGQDVNQLVYVLKLESLFSSTFIDGDSFDEMVASAVVEFQEKYASEILAPYGLTHGTGYVGKSTRAKLNQLYGCSTQQVTSSVCGIKEYKMAFVLVENSGNIATNEDVSKINVLKQEASETFSWATKGLASLDVSYPVKVIKMNNDSSVENIVKEFYKQNSDDFHFLTIFNTYDDAGTQYHILVKNDVSGIGLSIFDNTNYYGSGGNLLGVNWLKNIDNYYNDEYQDLAVNAILHETSHQWGAYVKFVDDDGQKSGALRNPYNMAHWDKKLETGYDLLNGFSWTDNGDGTFTAKTITDYKHGYSNLDLYLMGLISKDEVGPIKLIVSDYDTKYIQSGTTISGNLKNISIQQIIDAEGEVKCDSQANQPSITVTSPNGGETWKQGETHKITWTGLNFPSNGTITMQLNGTTVAHNYYIFSEIDNTGSVSWTISNTIEPDTYKLRVFCGEKGTERYCSPDGTLTSNPSSQDFSDNYFTISSGSNNSGSCFLLLGRIGDSWQKKCGDTAYDPVADLNKDKTVDLLDNGFYGENKTNETWCKEKLNDTTNPCISTQPSITVTSPNGGETYKLGGSITVNWKTANVSSSEKFNLIRLRAYPNGQEYNLVEGVLNDGQEVITIPSSVPEGAYTLEIKSYIGDVLLFDASDSYFKIVSTTTPFSVDIKANGSSSPESILYKSQFTVSWTSTGADNCAAYGDYVPLVDGSGYWTDLHNLPASGSRVLIADHKNYGYTSPLQIGIQCFNNAQNTSVSQIVWVPVTNTQPSITVTSPNGGETWNIGETHNITWTTSNFGSMGVSINLLNPGATGAAYLKNIALNIPNSGSYQWTIPSDISGGTYNLMLVSYGGTAAQDYSDNYFTITSSVLTNYCFQLYEKITASYGKKCGDSAYDASADIDKDKNVGFLDLGLYSDNKTNENWCKEKLNVTTSPCAASATTSATNYCNQLYTKIQNSYKTKCGLTLYNPAADVDKDGEIGLGDLSFYAANQTNETWCQQKLSETTSPCITSYNTNDNSLASISDALAKIFEQIKAMLNNR